MIDTLRAATASVVGNVINTASLSPVSTELQYALASAHVPTVGIDISNIS
jgi:3-dehydroquinate dehydratase